MLAVLADVLLAQERVEEALAAARMAHELLLGGSCEESPSLVRLVYADALHAAGDHTGARVAIASARAELLADAAKIGDPLMRETYLTRVVENRAILARCDAWGISRAG